MIRQGYLTGPRWAFGLEFIYEVAHHYGVFVEQTGESKGLLTRTLTWTVSGDKDRLDAMASAIAGGVANWNRGRGR